MYSHASYAGLARRVSQKGSHGDDSTIGYPHEEFTSRGDVLGLDAMQIVVPGAVSCMGPNLEQRDVVEFPNGVTVSGTISANLHHHNSTGRDGLQMNEWGSRSRTTISFLRSSLSIVLDRPAGDQWPSQMATGKAEDNDSLEGIH